ncbi:hypothetical protein D8S78_07360 [Natrialba swarupiae]|nr:hypothetical protein [Natrialba swarupiae]
MSVTKTVETTDTGVVTAVRRKSDQATIAPDPTYTGLIEGRSQVNGTRSVDAIPHQLDNESQADPWLASRTDRDRNSRSRRDRHPATAQTVCDDWSPVDRRRAAIDWRDPPSP